MVSSPAMWTKHSQSGSSVSRTLPKIQILSNPILTYTLHYYSQISTFKTQITASFSKKTTILPRLTH